MADGLGLFDVGIRGVGEEATQHRFFSFNCPSTCRILVLSSLTTDRDLYFLLPPAQTVIKRHCERVPISRAFLFSLPTQSLATYPHSFNREYLRVIPASLSLSRLSSLVSPSYPHILLQSLLTFSRTTTS